MMSLSHPVSTPVKWLCWKVWTRFRMEQGLTSRIQARPAMGLSAAVAVAMVDVVKAAAAVKRKANEYFAAFYSPAGSHVVVDGRSSFSRRRRLQAIAGFGIAA